MVDLLTRVGIPDPAARARAYPHELSGGMRQRAMIAMAIANDPRVLIADEPTTALDVTIQAQVLTLLGDLRRERGMGVVFITHSLPVVAEIADRVAVMYAGEIVEQGPAATVFARPLHPYTSALLASAPREDGGLPDGIPGTVPLPHELPPGCAFAPRCRHRIPACDAQRPALVEAGEDHTSRCLAGARMTAAPPPLLVAEGVTRRFGARGLFTRARPVQAVTDVSLSLGRGETVGLVGESGSGKSTLGRMLLGLLPPSEGQVWFDGVDLARATPAERRVLRRRMQIVFQDPHSSLDPRRTIGAQIADGPTIHALVPPAERRAQVEALLGQVGLAPMHADRYPHEFSGGQRQRIGIARALATNPEFLVADEPVSALDVSVQAQVLALLADLRSRFGLALLFISHDLAVVRSLCDRVVVLYLGRVMESGPVAQVLEAPRHPYTQALLSAAPSLEASRRRTRILLQGDPPSPSAPPSGCVFRTRCPVAMPACAETVPALVDGVACLRVGEGGVRV